MKIFLILEFLIFVSALRPNNNPSRRITTLGSEANVFRYHGNNSFFKILVGEEDNIVVGGRNELLILSVNGLKEVQRSNERIKWSPTSSSYKVCSKKYDDSICQNFIRIFTRVNKNEILVCGTHARDPMCRFYNPVTGEVLDEFLASWSSPIEATVKSTFISVNGKVFSGMFSLFSSLDLQTCKKYGSAEKKRPECFVFNVNSFNSKKSMQFVHLTLDGDYVYFFFHEAGSSKVGRVCQNDEGPKHVDEKSVHSERRRRWTTFLTAELICSLPGTPESQPSYFKIQSATHAVESAHGERLIYGIFATDNPMLRASAVCAFSLDDVEDSFRGPFTDWKIDQGVPISSPNNPRRPGLCSTWTLSFNFIEFIESHPLMYNSITARPLLITSDHQLTQVAVDPKVLSNNGESYDMLFIGTDDGKVLRVVNKVVIEEIQVMNASITDLKFVRKGAHKQLIVVSGDEIASFPLSTCSSISCKECVALRHPSCAWNNATSECINWDSAPPGTQLIQDIHHGSSNLCPDHSTVILATTSNVVEEEGNSTMIFATASDDKEDNLTAIPATSGVVEEGTLSIFVKPPTDEVMFSEMTFYISIAGVCIASVSIGVLISSVISYNQLRK